MGIEPTSPAWKAGALPLSYTRTPNGNRDARTRRCVQRAAPCDAVAEASGDSNSQKTQNSAPVIQKISLKV